MDNIEVLLQKIPDDNEYREQLIKKYQKYRNLFEEHPNDINLNYYLIKYLTDLESYICGITKIAPIGEYDKLPVIFESNNYEEGFSNLKEYVNILSNSIDTLDYSQDPNKIKMLTSHIQKEYKNLNIRKQELDQKICKSLFRLMIYRLKNYDIEAAKELVKQFGIDMRIYVVNYMKTKLVELKEEKKFDKAEYVWKYIYGKNPTNEKDLRLWEFIVNLEDPKADFCLPNESLPVSIENKTNIGIKNTIKNIIYKQESKKDFVSFKKTKDVIIRSTISGFADVRDLANASIMISDPMQYPNLRIIFEEGISEISFDYSGIANDRYKPNIVEVVIPSTARVIKQNCFYGAINLREVNLKHTTVFLIEESAFAKSGIKNISFPRSLKFIGRSAFYSCEYLFNVELTLTQLEMIGPSGFENSGLYSISLPDSLKNISSRAFADTSKLGGINLSNSKIKSIENSVFINSGIKEISFPYTLWHICANAFANTMNLKGIDASQTCLFSIEDNAFDSSGIEYFKVPNSLTIIGKRAFLNTRRLVSIDLSKTKVKILSTMTFYNSNIRSIQLPEYIGLDNFVFRNCKNLEDIQPYRIAESIKRSIY